MTREQYLQKLEDLRQHSSGELLILEHEWLLCEYVKSLETQIKSLQPHPIDMVNMNVGDLVVLKDGSRNTLHCVTFYGKDEAVNEFWKYDGNITKLDGTYCYLKEDGTSIGTSGVFAIKVYHDYDIRFKVTSDR